MRIYLAGIECCLRSLKGCLPQKIYSLSSYFCIKKYSGKNYSDYIRAYKDFMLDSGAFSFINSSDIISIDWNAYIDEYINYINEHSIQKFFELDIDSLVGYEAVKKYRNRIEKLTNKQCIPVWHRSRGQNEFFRLCDEYHYIAIGGIAIKRIKPSEYKYFDYLIKEAHKRDCKIHGLGFTNSELLKKYHFDSVDSSSWTSGGRYGSSFKFYNGKIFCKKREENLYVSDHKNLTIHNFNEWIKFQKYAEVHL